MRIARHLPRAATRLLALGAAVAAVACSDFGTAPDDAVSIEFSPPQLGVVVAGDTLRDSTGAVEPLLARVFNADDELIAGAPLRYFALDSGTAIVDSLTGIVVGGQTGTVRVIASVDGLQSQPITLPITYRPDSAYALDSLRDTVNYSIANPAANVRAMGVHVAHDSVIAGVDSSVGVAGWRVRYRIVEPAGLPPADTLGTLLVHVSTGRPFSVDTTDANGDATRVRLRIAQRAPVPDSVVVEALVSRPDGTPLPGTPITFTTIVVTSP